MKRLLMGLLVLGVLACGTLPAQAVSITYSTSGSKAEVFLTRPAAAISPA